MLFSHSYTPEKLPGGPTIISRWLPHKLNTRLFIPAKVWLGHSRHSTSQDELSPSYNREAGDLVQIVELEITQNCLEILLILQQHNTLDDRKQIHNVK